MSGVWTHTSPFCILESRKSMRLVFRDYNTVLLLFISYIDGTLCNWLQDNAYEYRGCSSVVERPLCMRKVWGSIPHISILQLFKAGIYQNTLQKFGKYNFNESPFYSTALLLRISYLDGNFSNSLQDNWHENRGCSSVVERPLRMRKVWGSIPHISILHFGE